METIRLLFCKSAIALSIAAASTFANIAGAGVSDIQVYNGSYNVDCASLPSVDTPYGNNNVTAGSYEIGEDGQVVLNSVGEPMIKSSYASFYKVRDFSINIPGVLNVSIDDPKYNNLLNIEAECVGGRMRPVGRVVSEVKETLARICHRNLVAGVEAIDNIPGFTLYFGSSADTQDIVGILAPGQGGANGLNDGCEEFVDHMVEHYFLQPLINFAPPVIDYFHAEWETKSFYFFWVKLLFGTQWGNEETYFADGSFETRRRQLSWNSFKQSFYGEDFPSVMVNCQGPYYSDVDAQQFVKQADGSVQVHGQAIKASKFFCTVPDKDDPDNRAADMHFSFHFHVQQEYLGSNL